MGKKDKNKKKGKGAEKTTMKTDKKIATKQKKLLAKIGESDIEQIVANLEAEEARLQTVIETICSPPSPRSSFTLVAHPEKDELILFGGEFFNGQKICIYNDLFFYNISKNEWKLVKSPSGPTPRSGHQMVSIASDGGQLWLFGGEHASPSQMQFYHYKDLWVLRLSTKKWEKINAPNCPSPRSGHRMVASKKKLVIFGGFHDNNQSYKYFNDIHMFSLESYSWLKIDVSGVIVPPPRSGCCFAACPDGKILVWGGYSKSQIKKDVDRGIVHTDMFALTPDKSDANKYKWSNVKAGGFKPLPRSSVGYAPNVNNKVLCFGGVMDTEEDEEDLRGQFGDELYSLDLASHAWRLLEVTKKSKEKSKVECIDEKTDLSESKSTVSTDGVFKITVGGAPSSSKSLFNLCADKSKASFGPSPRMNPGLCVSKGNLFLFGGIFEDDVKQYTYNDFYSLDLHKLDMWKTLIANDKSAHDWIESDSDTSSSEDDDDDDDDDDEDMSENSEMETD